MYYNVKKNEKINDKNISDKNNDMNITVDNNDDNNTTYIFFVTVFI